jgi:hypothetical protein
VLPILFSLYACDGKNPQDSAAPEEEEQEQEQVDSDGDGVPDSEDCAPDDASVYPGAEEVPYDGLDNDCDPTTPDDDLDGDGYVAAADCDDGNAAVSPAAAEICDGVDNDCDGEADEGVQSTWYTDGDGDEWGDESVATEACEAPAGTVPVGGDCDDTDPAVHPGAEEVCDGRDNDCDGIEDPDASDATWAGTWSATFSGGTMGYSFEVTCSGDLTSRVDLDGDPAVTLAMDHECCETDYGNCFLLYFEGSPDGAVISGDVGWTMGSACADYECATTAGWEGSWSEPSCDGSGGMEATFSGAILYPVDFWTYAYAEGKLSLGQQ